MNVPTTRPLLATLALVLLAHSAGARLPPPAVPLDGMLKSADRIVIGRVQPGSVKEFADPKRKSTFRELTLIVTRSLDGKDIGKQVNVTMGSIPVKVFPASKLHPQGRFLLTGWDFEGHTDSAEKGLDLYADQVWFLERFRDDRLRDAKSAPHGVDHFESAQKIEHAGLIELFAKRATVKKVREHIDKHYQGRIPILAVQGVYGSSDSNAGPFLWDYIQQCDEREKAWAELAKEDKIRARMERSAGSNSVYYAFRSLNSLGRFEAIPLARKALASKNEETRRSALETLKRFQDTEQVARLLELLKTTERHDERQRLITTLGEIGDPRAIPALIDLLRQEKDDTVRLALFQLTDVRLTANGDFARRWWERNKDRPRWHWLKQGIEQDLHLMSNKHAVEWGGDFGASGHLELSTCWRQPGKTKAEGAEEWATWWRANKDLPQERWILDSFKAAGHPLPDLASKEAVEALIKAYNTDPDHWWKNGPAIDINHHYWCQRLLTRLTGWDTEDANYVHYYRPHYFDHKKYGPLWADEWKKSRYGAKLNPIAIPERQPFTMEEEDRRLLCDDFGSWDIRAAFQGPLVRKQFPGILGKSIVATFEITLVNSSKRELTLHTKPGISGETGTVEGFGSSLSAFKWVCTSHLGDFATLKPGQTIRWLEQHTVNAREHESSWSCFHLHFEERGQAGTGWRGRIVSPWVAVKVENIRDE